MKVFDLRCEHGHVFEGWFASEADYQSQLESGLLECPVCGSLQVGKAVSAPRLNSKSNRDTATQRPPQDAATVVGAAAAPSPEQMHAKMQARWLAHARQVLREGENVGAGFAAEARRIHAGEAPERAIHGQASVQEVVDLLEDGVPVLPLPDSAKQPLQ